MIGHDICLILQYAGIAIAGTAMALAAFAALGAALWAVAAVVLLPPWYAIDGIRALIRRRRSRNAR